MLGKYALQAVVCTFTFKMVFVENKTFEKKKSRFIKQMFLLGMLRCGVSVPMEIATSLKKIAMKFPADIYVSLGIHFDLIYIVGDHLINTGIR